MKPQTKDRVDVFGCVGTITKIENNTVTVAGIYYYSGKPPLSEPWTFYYSLADFKTKTKRGIWDLTQAKERYIK